MRTSSSDGNAGPWIVMTNFLATKRESWSVSISSAHTIARATTNTMSSYSSTFGESFRFCASSSASGWQPNNVPSSSSVRSFGSTTSTQVITPSNVGSRKFIITVVDIRPGGSTRLHEHRTVESMYYILEGRGEVVSGHEKKILGPDTAVYFPAGSTHGIRNVGKARLR